jgi:DNA-binding LacI/PurR family transcriptional regulator
VLNTSGTNNVRVGEQTAARVWEVIRRVGYVPNLAARNLASGRNSIIGVFTYEAVFPVSSADYYHPFLEGIEDEAGHAGCHLLLFTGSGANGRRSIYSEGGNSLQLADGAILLGLNEDKSELSRLLAEGFPFVFVGRRETPDDRLSYVAADYIDATHRMVDVITRYGHRRLALVRGAWRREPMVDREAGFRRATEAPDAPVDLARIVQIPADEDYAELIRTLRHQRVTAILTDDSNHAGHLYSAALSCGLRVPEDLSIAALSDYLGARREPNLTTVLTPRRRMGSEAVRLLSKLLAGGAEPEVQRSVLACELEPGTTVGPPPRAGH